MKNILQDTTETQRSESQSNRFQRIIGQIGYCEIKDGEFTSVLRAKQDKRQLVGSLESSAISSEGGSSGKKRAGVSPRPLTQHCCCVQITKIIK